MTPENVAAFALGVLIVVTSVALGIPAFRIARSTRDLVNLVRMGVDTAERRRMEAAQCRMEDRERAEQERLDREAAAERAASRSAQEQEDLDRAQEIRAQNMVLLSTISDAIRGNLAAPSALTDPAREGWDMAVERMRTQLKAGLKESQTAAQTAKTTQEKS